MASQSQGIHQLLQAEKRAKDKLEDAKKSKSPFPLACEGFVTEWTGGRGGVRSRARGSGAGQLRFQARAALPP